MSRHIIRNLSAEILENQELAVRTYRLTLSLPEDLHRFTPGRFVMVQASTGRDPLLRRAFSIHDISPRQLRILYRVVGRGTGWLSRRKPGDPLNLVGPLGTGFGLAPPIRKALLVAGGMGIAPFTFLARRLREQGVEVLLFYGARTAGELVPVDTLTACGVSVLTATDDGSRGEPGTIVDLFQKHLRKEQSVEALKVYACGPRAMLFEVARRTRNADVVCEVSLESTMACGMGTCMGCVTETVNGYQRVCREGPVFKADDLLFNDR